MTKLVTICGPTGVGKTRFAIALAKGCQGEIIGADSMQVYRYMDIGTAKPDAAERAEIPHHLVDFLTPDQGFDAGQYARTAAAAIDVLGRRNKVPVVAGGTGLYIRALRYGLVRTQPACPQTLSRLNRVLADKGSVYLHRRLSACDAEAAKQIHPNDGFRIVRALEVFQNTGTPLSERHQAHRFRTARYDCLTIGLSMDRNALYERINHRVDRMMAQGLLSEVERLLEMGYPLSLKPLKSIGYRHMGWVIKKEMSVAEAVTLLKRDTRRYAKRQYTWFNKEPGIVWLTPSQTGRAQELVSAFLA